MWEMGDGSGLISSQNAPLSLAMGGKPAAGYTTAEVPILIKRSNDPMALMAF
jgi:hypothetical protein